MAWRRYWPTRRDGWPRYRALRLRLQRSPWSVHDDAGRRAVGVQLAFGVDDAAFGCRGAPADVDHFAFAAELARFLGDRPRQIHLELQSRETAAGRHRRVDC